MTTGVYAIENTITGMLYVGGAADIERRWMQHESDLRGRRHINRNLQAAWNESGAWAFKLSTLEICEQELLTEREQHYLDAYMPLGFTYNVSRRATGTIRHKRVPPPPKQYPPDYIHAKDLDDFEKMLVMAFRKGGKIRVLCMLAAFADNDAEFYEAFAKIQALILKGNNAA